MPIVFLPQNPMKKDHITGVLSYKLNQDRLKKYGTIKEVCPFSAVKRSDRAIFKHIEKVLRNYNFDNGDCIFMSGDSVATVGCIVYLTQYKHNFRLLRWNHEIQDYEIHDIYTNAQPSPSPEQGDPN